MIWFPGLVDMVLRFARQPPPTTDLEIEDLADLAPAANRVRRRKASEIRSITLHQNGFAWADDNPLTPRIRAHFQIKRSGKLAEINPPEFRLRSSSNGANAHTIAIEIAGNLQGEPGCDDEPPVDCVEVDVGGWFKPERFGRHTLLDAQVIAARRLIVRLVRQFPQIDRIHAHRQFAADRPLCPGWEIWRRVGMWAQDELGLSDGGADFADGGTPIPASWKIRENPGSPT